MNYSTE